MHEVHHHDDLGTGTGVYVFLAFIITLLVVGLLVWRFLPSRASEEGERPGQINVNMPSLPLPGNTEGGSQNSPNQPTY